MHLLESFTIHARALQYFFYPPDNSRHDDVLAQDFMPVTKVWSALVGPKPTTLSKVSERVGTEIAHISYGRLTIVTPEAKQWKIVDLANALLGLTKTFVEHADHLDPVWRAKAEGSVMDVSKSSRTPSATNEVNSSGTTPTVRAPISVNTPSVQTLIVDASGHFPPNDAD